MPCSEELTVNQSSTHLTADQSDQSPFHSFRIGHGYDLHRLDEHPPNGEGRPFILGGVHIEHSRGPVGHSDADALLHAITDALLGAIGQPDIGQLFPDTDPRHESQDSADFVKEAALRVSGAGMQILNLDATVICERPKVGPHRDAIHENIARLLAVPAGLVNVKAKTHEGVDAVGEGRAVEVHCVVLLSSKNS